eukprot:TRINITY_DN41402_c0_g1_i1.p1 TRINITY_DN41402_c0_g1~~TRINITY_DN41402_c0_g1_i1.p1  ORF type:complete len:366 (+),score=64.68 TRINITY_DN41402_c0_g1_i1:43-1140(+)
MSINLAMFDMEPAYVETSFLQKGSYPSVAGADVDALSQSILRSGLGHKPWTQGGSFPASESAPDVTHGQNMYHMRQHCDLAGWPHASMQGEVPVDGSWPVSGNCLWPSAQRAAVFPSPYSWPTPPPGLEHMLHRSCNNPELDIDKECDCAALSVALAALPKDGEPIERVFSVASTACTTSECSEEPTLRTEAREPPRKVQMLVQAEGSQSGAVTVIWTVDAKKLKSGDKILVSPPFEVACVSRRFKMMLCPRPISDKKGGACFKNAKGRGFVQLKCETGETADGLGMMSINISVGPGRADSAWQSPLKQPVHHDFDDCGVCSFEAKSEAMLPESAEKDDWNFLQAVDGASQTFAVRLDLQALATA